MTVDRNKGEEGLTTYRSLLVAAMLVIVLTPVDTASAQTDVEVAQRSKLIELSTHKTPAREDVIDELRKEKLKISEARKFGVEVSDAEVDEVYATMASRMRLTPERLTEQLARSGVNIDTLKHRIRADMAWARYKQRQRLQQDPPPPGRDNG
jgi:parvulin-like peptidyl-prolyl isomerase